MLTRDPARRVRLLILASGLAMATFGTSRAAAAANRHSLVVTFCVMPNGDLVHTTTWARMRVTDWSYFVDSSEGSGGTTQPVPVPGRSGTVVHTFQGDPNAVNSVTVTLYRGVSAKEVATATLHRPAGGWPAC